MKIIIHISWLIFLFNSAFSQNGIISTIAGNGVGGYSGNGGQATDAELDLLDGIALDDSTNIYIVDLGNNVIRKVVASTGIITTVAGSGLHGYSGDGGPATSAALNYPSFIYIDKQFNIYFSDAENCVIRKVTYSTGIINTVVGDGYIFHHAMYPPQWGGYSGDGGPATNAELNSPNGIWLDDSNNIYFADDNNNVIRKVYNSTGIIITFVGDGYGASIYPTLGGYSGDGGAATMAELNGPSYVSFDKTGNMFIADEFNQVIRKVSTTGIISTVAGDYYYGKGYSGDGGHATAAEFNDPVSVVSDNSGNLYIADVYNNVIRFVDNSTGFITSMAGNFSYGRGYTGDGGPATSAELNFPIDAILDTNGNLFISDNSNNVVREVKTSTNTGKNEVKKNEDISVFPNPAKNEITVEFVGTQNFVSTIQFYELTGREVLTQKLTKATTTLDCSGLSEGAYLYKITDENGKVVKADKIVVER